MEQLVRVGSIITSIRRYPRFIQIRLIITRNEFNQTAFGSTCTQLGPNWPTDGRTDTICWCVGRRMVGAVCNVQIEIGQSALLVNSFVFVGECFVEETFEFVGERGQHQQIIRQSLALVGVETAIKFILIIQHGSGDVDYQYFRVIECLQMIENGHGFRCVQRWRNDYNWKREIKFGVSIYVFCGKSTESSSIINSSSLLKCLCSQFGCLIPDEEWMTSHPATPLPVPSKNSFSLILITKSFRHQIAICLLFIISALANSSSAEWCHPISIPRNRKKKYINVCFFCVSNGTSESVIT